MNNERSKLFTGSTVRESVTSPTQTISLSSKPVVSRVWLCTQGLSRMKAKKPGEAGRKHRISIQVDFLVSKWKEKIALLEHNIWFDADTITHSGIWDVLREGEISSRTAAPLGQGPLLSSFLFTVCPPPSRHSTNTWWMNEWLTSIPNNVSSRERNQNLSLHLSDPWEGLGRTEMSETKKRLRSLFQSRLSCYLHHPSQGRVALVLRGLRGEGKKRFLLVLPPVQINQYVSAPGLWKASEITLRHGKWAMRSLWMTMTMTFPFLPQDLRCVPRGTGQMSVFSVTGLGLIRRHHSSVPFLDSEVRAVKSHSI